MSWRSELAFIGGGHFLQTIYGLLGVAILIFALMPGVMQYFRKNADN